MIFKRCEVCGKSDETVDLTTEFESVILDNMNLEQISKTIERILCDECHESKENR